MFLFSSLIYHVFSWALGFAVSLRMPLSYIFVLGPAAWSVPFVPGQAETRGTTQQKHEDPHDRRTDSGWAFPLHRPWL